MQYIIKIKGDKWETYIIKDKVNYFNKLMEYDEMGYTCYFECTDYIKRITVVYLERNENGKQTAKD